MKHFKNKRYWILMPPFLIIGAIPIFFFPNDYMAFYLLAVPITFWLTYYIWDGHAKEKNNSKDSDDGS